MRVACMRESTTCRRRSTTAEIQEPVLRRERTSWSRRDDDAKESIASSFRRRRNHREGVTIKWNGIVWKALKRYNSFLTFAKVAETTLLIFQAEGSTVT